MVKPGPLSLVSASGIATWSIERVLSESQAAAGRPIVIDPVRQLTEAYVLALLKGAGPGAPQNPTELGSDISQAVHDAVHQQTALYYILRAVRIAHARAVELVAASGRLDDVRPSTARARLWRERAATFADGFSSMVARVYTTEAQRLTVGSAATRLRLVKDVLADHPVDLAHAERALGLDLADHHLAAVLRVRPGSATSAERLNQFASELARVLDARRLLVLVVEPTVVWLWTSWRQPPVDDLAGRARTALSPPPGVRVSIGPVAPGLAGFRRSHHGALATTKVAGDRYPSWICDYADVAVVSLLANDPLHAQWFVDETLGALGQHGRRFADLRETLRVYLAFGRSRARAAECLHIARNTVAYRVEKAVSLLGRPISSDHLHVRLALEIARFMPPRPDEPVGRSKVPDAVRSWD